MSDRSGTVPCSTVRARTVNRGHRQYFFDRSELGNLGPDPDLDVCAKGPLSALITVENGLGIVSGKVYFQQKRNDIFPIVIVIIIRLWQRHRNVCHCRWRPDGYSVVFFFFFNVPTTVNGRFSFVMISILATNVVFRRTSFYYRKPCTHEYTFFDY